MECESPSDDPAGITRFTECLPIVFAAWETSKIYNGGNAGPHLQLHVRAAGRGKRVRSWRLAIPIRFIRWHARQDAVSARAQGRLWGPGVLDMKGGIAFFVFAMRALRELDVPVNRKVVLQLNSDEEIGSRILTGSHGKRGAAKRGSSCAGARSGIGRQS